MSENKTVSPETEANGPAKSCPIDWSGQGSECGTSLWKPPKFDLRFLFLVLTLTAIWLALLRVQNMGSMTVISIIMLTYMFGCPRTRKAVLTVVPAMYLPYAWLLGNVGHHFSRFHWSWIESWESLPGMAPTVFVFPGLFPELFTLRMSDSATSFGFLSPTTTIIIFFGAVLPIRFCKISRWWIAIPLFAFCVAFSLMSYRHFCGARLDLELFMQTTP